MEHLETRKNSVVYDKLVGIQVSHFLKSIQDKVETVWFVLYRIKGGHLWQTATLVSEQHIDIVDR